MLVLEFSSHTNEPAKGKKENIFAFNSSVVGTVSSESDETLSQACRRVSHPRADSYAQKISPEIGYISREDEN